MGDHWASQPLRWLRPQPTTNRCAKTEGRRCGLRWVCDLQTGLEKWKPLGIHPVHVFRIYIIILYINWTMCGDVPPNGWVTFLNGKVAYCNFVGKKAGSANKQILPWCSLPVHRSYGVSPLDTAKRQWSQLAWITAHTYKGWWAVKSTFHLFHK